MISLIRHTTFVAVLATLIVTSFVACSTEESGKDDKLIAAVFNKKLYQSELNQLIGGGMSAEDSIQLTRAYIDNWVRESILMNEAEKYVPDDLDIDALVRDYRASLILHNYEKLLVETQLDSMITEADITSYYDEHKEQFKLEEPVIKCYLLKVPKPIDNWDDVKDWWKSNDEEDYKKLIDFASRNAQVYLLNDSLWYNLSDVNRHLPKDKLDTGNYKRKDKIDTDDDDFRYLYKKLEHTATGEYAPLGFVRNQATKVILHKRKIQLLEDTKEQMVKQETKDQNVKIYLN